MRSQRNLLRSLFTSECIGRSSTIHGAGPVSRGMLCLEYCDTMRERMLDMHECHVISSLSNENVDDEKNRCQKS